ncbi:MauE/DoxX family redox-associated membrane protein [Sphingobacterium sp. MYb388]|uniref:MauE/DoxX family redox-associated membrane protein n=1 Tax=Sphingobacterium sp. MYb388 TaxID=2745437 RepID=UPI0030A2875B
MMKTKNKIQLVIILALMALWLPISIDKLINFTLFKSAMVQQPFADSLGRLLAYTLPLIEFATGILFVFPKWRLLAFRSSIAMMLIFTGYVALALLKVWEDIPCGCGLVFNQLGWVAHLWLNLIFLIISIVGCILEKNIRSLQIPLKSEPAIK